MDLIDERGRVLGLVNVVDAAVVLLAAILIVGGLNLVFADGDDRGNGADEASQYGTVAFTVPLDSDAALIDAGDALTPVGEGDRLEAIDVYRSFRPNGSVYVVARVGYAGAMTANSRLYAGDSARYVTNGHRVDVDVLGINETDEPLWTRDVSVVIASNADPAVANALSAGDEATIGDDVVATVESVDDREGDGFLVGLTVRALDRGRTPSFDGESLRVGNRLTIVTDDAVVRGRIAATGTDDPTTVDASG